MQQMQNPKEEMKVEQIIEHLNSVAIGQYDAKSTLATAVAHKMNGFSLVRHVLLYGPSGCGKSMLVEELASYVQLQLLRVSALQAVDPNMVKLVSQAKAMIISIDDIEMLSKTDQMLLVNLLEGRYHVQGHGLLNVKNIIFICSATCSNLDSLIPQLQAQFTARAALNSLSEVDFLRILQTGALNPYIAALEKQGVKASITDTGLAQLACMAAKYNKLEQNIGVRRLYLLAHEIFQSATFCQQKHLTIDSKYLAQFDIILDYSGYIL